MVARSEHRPEKAQVKRTRQKSAALVTVPEFLSLDRPKGDLNLEVERELVSLTSLERIHLSMAALVYSPGLSPLYASP